MKKRCLSLLFVLCSISISLFSQKYIADFEVAKEEVLRKIPIQYIHNARTSLHIAYQHTSHGTHVSRGLFGLQDYKLGDDTLFAITNNNITIAKLDFKDYALESYAEGSDDASDLSRNETAFIQATRNYLDDPANAEVNVVMWSWCDIAGHNVTENYLPGMKMLIQEYGISGSKIGSGQGQREKSVTFIFMTGHANVGDNIGEEKPKQQADLITNYCNTNQYYCLDYYSIDSHDMEDNYWEDAGDNGNSSAYGGNFYQDWQDMHKLGEHYYENKESPGGTIEYGAHNTQHITANRKAYAMWWILARISGWNGDTITPTQDIPIDSIVITDIVPEIVIGESLQFEANIYPDSSTNNDVQWIIENMTGVASITDEGLFTAIDTGIVKVIAISEEGDIADTILINIFSQPIPIESITVYVENNFLPISYIDSTLELGVDIIPEDATNKEVRWEIVNVSGHAIIDDDGIVTPLDAGLVTATASAMDGSERIGSLDIEIKEIPILIESIDINILGKSPPYFVGDSVFLSAIIQPESSTNQILNWSISNPEKVNLSPSGFFVLEDTGYVEIVAISKDESNATDTIEIYIDKKHKPIESISLSNSGGSPLEIMKGDTMQILATIYPEDATNQNIQWNIENISGDGVINQEGYLTALDTGLVKVYVVTVEGKFCDSIFIHIIEDFIPIESITILPNYFEVHEVIYPGISLQFYTKIEPVNASTKDVKWEILNITGNALINKEGFFTALDTGVVKVIGLSMSDELISDTVDVTILEEPILIESISLEIKEKTQLFYVGDSVLISPNIHPLNATNQSLEWTIRGTKYSSIDNNSGLFIAGDSGNLTIIASSQDGSNVSDSLEINVINKPILIDSILLSVSNNGSPFVFKDDTIKMEVTVFPQNATNKIFKWRVKNLTGQAVIDENAYLVAMNTGYVNVVAYTTDGSNISDTLRINIIEQPPLPPITANIEYSKTFENKFRIVAIYIDKRKNIDIYQKY